MVPQTKVFVGSLPQGSKPEDLRKLFERFGVVTECDIMNRCGFVHMQTEEQAAAAIRALHNSTFNGGVISVERGRIKERGQRGGGRGGRGSMRGGMERRGGGPVRHAPPPRDAPYMRDRPGPVRGYERGPPAAPYDERYAYGEDRRGFALMDRGPRDAYAPPAPAYPDERYQNHISVVEGTRRYDEPPYDDRHYDERAQYERPRPAHHIPNGDMYSRRSPAPMYSGRGGPAPVAGGYERDHYVPQYMQPPLGRQWLAG
ncbi:RNA-binding protein 4.1-like isoform X1 [Bombyx mandarina]|uniref:RRM domain-containing protein n=2 Tax=Bombyx TaxID=7090 RepID=A0A8R2AG66_BOMMO|nr:bmp-2 protein isoform X2 [Bombyx mori]XP_028041165.1 RNA-binding protein 4.1-like isoform X1 [Bombyx mandarina]